MDIHRLTSLPIFRIFLPDCFPRFHLFCKSCPTEWRNFFLLCAAGQHKVRAIPAVKAEKVFGNDANQCGFKSCFYPE